MPITPPWKQRPGEVYKCIVDYQRKPYLVTWSSGSFQYPDFSAFPANFDYYEIRQTHEMATLWANSTPLDYGVHASVRVSIPPRNERSENPQDDDFPISKLAHPDEDSLAMIRNEIEILSDPKMQSLPTVMIAEQPIVDEEAIVGFRMKRLTRLDFSTELYERKTDIRKALERLHEAGFCHGDFTPSNVMKNELGQITLIDFGYAGRIGEAVPLFLKRHANFSGDVFSADHDWEAFRMFLP